MAITLKRVYEPPARSDGRRVLVDRIWPRGVKKDAVDEWLRDVAPSDALRKWFDHDPAKWPEFRRRYLAELKEHRTLLLPLARRRRVTLLFGARDEEHNNAVVVKEHLQRLSAAASRSRPGKDARSRPRAPRARGSGKSGRS